MNNYLLELSLKSDFTRIGRKIGELYDKYTDNVLAGTIIFLVLLFGAIFYINSKK